jgi:hypothetical protein
VSANWHSKAFLPGHPFQGPNQLALNAPLGRRADAVDDLDHQLDQAVGDLLGPQPTVSSERHRRLRGTPSADYLAPPPLRVGYFISGLDYSNK